MPTIVLFDIDGTLITTAGAGRRAIERAFAAHFGRDDALTGTPFGGMTDRAIARAGLAAIGHPTDGTAADAAIDGLLAVYPSFLQDELARTDGIRLHAGVTSVLDTLERSPDVAIGLGTGNIREGARLKLDHVGVFERFAFGGFGCDAEDRTALLRIGATRGAAHLGVPLDRCRIVVIGDTPKDVAAAHGIGADALAVATSGFTVEALERTGAAQVVSDLTADDLPRWIIRGA